MSMHAQMIGNGKGREVYFMGIIDVLQEYNARKHAETALKVYIHSLYASALHSLL
jgi:Phosphatidylinositol-4-phosphate 5-Kinase